ncbi:MAG TPA: hypothetical protein VIJ16_09255, partial [Gemmatimonadaceae bacterium]
TDKAARIRQALSSLRVQQRTALGVESLTPRFQLFLLPAVLLLLLDAFLVERRERAEPISGGVGAAGAVAALLLVSVISGCAGTRQSAAAAQAYNLRQFPEAVALYRSAIEQGDMRPRTVYNFGTSLLAVDSLQSAIDAYERVIELPDAELRYRGLFNLGLAHLRRGLAAAPGASNEDLDAALMAYKKVLLMRNDDVDAKWNYELALHAKKAGGGGGGGGANSNPSPSPESQSPTPSGGLGMDQARQLLASAAREERDVEAKQQRKSRSTVPPGGKDW